MKQLLLLFLLVGKLYYALLNLSQRLIGYYVILIKRAIAAFTVLFIFLCLSNTAKAQYADLGTGALKNDIWWFNWNGFTLTNGASKTFVTDDGLTVTITFSNVSGPALHPSVMDTYSGDLLYKLYNFSNTSIDPAFYYIAFPTPYTIKFTANITATRNGVAAPFHLVAGDAEESMINVEYTTLTSSGSAWNSIDFYSNSSQANNPLSGCGTNSVVLQDSYDGTDGVGRIALVETDAPASGSLTINATLDEQAPGGGGMGVTFGIFAPIDRGDLPASYGFAQHALSYQINNSCNYTSPYPSMTESQSLKLGAIASDADPIQYTDDNAHGAADEDALTTFPAYNGTGTYSLTLPLVNTTGSNTYLTGWFDKNDDGIFNPGESATVTIPNNSTSATLTWTGLPAILPSNTNDSFAFRFRLSTDQTATQNATGYAKDGEVEDYYASVQQTTTSCTAPSTSLNISTGYTLSGTTMIAGQKDSSWTVNAEGPDMQTALSFDDGTGKGNTTGPPGFPSGAALSPLTPGPTANAYILTTYPGWPTGFTYLGCFNGNTIYTPIPTSSDGSNGGVFYNISSCSMTIRRKFVVCSNTSQATNFLMTIYCDNYVNNVIVDGDSISPHVLYNTGTFSLPTPLIINSTITLSPGTHTIDVKCANAENVNTANGDWFPLPSGEYQWNPMGIGISGSITATGNILTAGTACCNQCTTTSTLDTTIFQGQNYLGHTSTSTFNDTLVNAGGCDSIITINLTVNNSCAITTAASNYLTINTGYNPATNSTVAEQQHDPLWIVTALSADMENAPCYENTTAATAPTPGLSAVPAALIGQGVYSLSSSAGAGYISSFPYGTIYTPLTTSNITNCYMNIRRTFVVSGSTAQPVTFNFTTTIDDYVDNMIVDAASPSQVTLFTNTNPASYDPTETINTTLTLTPGVHTLDIKCSNWENPPGAPGGGIYFTVNGSQMQWNPFIFKLAGTISTPTSALQNIICATPTSSIIDTTICQGQSFLGHTTLGTYIDTLINVAGADSIRTVNLTINNNCTPQCPLINSINISTGYNANLHTSIPAGQQDSSWIVTAMSNDMATAYCSNNTSGVSGPSGAAVSPVSIGGPAYVITTFPSPWIQSDKYVSCFPFNTIYTVAPSTSNITNCTMSLNRKFYVNGTGNQNVNLNFSVSIDDGCAGVILDAGTSNAIQLLPGGSGLTPAASVNTTLNMSPGVHTLTILAGNYEDVNGSYFNVPSGASEQWNPFGVAVSGTISSGNSILQNKSCCLPTTAVFDTTICPGQNYLGHTTTGVYTETLTNATGCDSIITINLTVATLSVNAGGDSLVCKNTSFNLSGSGTGIVQYAWSPKALLNDSTLQNPTVTIGTLPATFYLTGTNSTGCTLKDTVVITVQTLTIQTGKDTTVCAGNTVQFNTTGANTYAWLPVTGLSNPAIANPVDTAIAAVTQYVVTGTSTIGCTATDTINITGNPDPVVKTTTDTAICINDAAQLNTTGANTYSWAPSTTLNDLTIGNPIASPVVPTKYIVTGTNTSTGCTGKDSVTVSVNPLPAITKTSDTAICIHSSATIYATGGTTYQWSPAATLSSSTISNPVATPLVPITYYVTVTDANGCIDNDSVKISFRPAAVFSAMPDTTICSVNGVHLRANGGDTYSWTPASLVDDPSSSSPLVTTAVDTTYTVNISESICHSTAVFTTRLHFAAPLILDLSKTNDIDCSEGYAILAITGADQYSWSPGTSLNDSTKATVQASPLQTQQYIVKGINWQTGCVGYDSITVYANFGTDSSSYQMATAFTPNGDGHNDCFGIAYWGPIEALNFSVYNRWGALIFHTSNPTDCWDGNFQGNPQPMDNYVYWITAKTACGYIERKGNVVLLR